MRPAPLAVLLVCCATSTELLAGDGITVNEGGSLIIQADAEASTQGDLTVRGHLTLVGTVQVGRDLRVSSSRVEDGSRIDFVGSGTHVVEIPRDAVPSETAIEGTLSGDPTPLFRGGTARPAVRPPPVLERSSRAAYQSPLTALPQEDSSDSFRHSGLSFPPGERPGAVRPPRTSSRGPPV